MTTKTERGMQMYSGTLTVLKRFTMGVLGVLGLSVLTAGQVSAQAAQLPVPNLFDAQVECQQAAGMAAIQTPTMAAMGSMTGSPLDRLLRGATGVGDPIPISVDDAASTTQAIFPTGVNPTTRALMPMPCGGIGGMDGTVTAMDAVDIAEGYAEVRMRYNDLVAAQAAEATAKTVFDAITGTPTAIQTRAYTDAQAATVKAQADLDAVSIGRIYQAGLAEWEAADAIDVAPWNKAVADANAAQNALSTAVYDDKYVALHASAYTLTAGLFTEAADGSLTVNAGGLTAYLDDLGSTADFVVDNVFDLSGQLLVPMMQDPDDATRMIPVVITDDAHSEVRDIKAHIDTAQKAKRALEIAQAAAVPNTPAYRRLSEALRRVGLVIDHQNDQYTKALADTRDTDGDPDNGIQSIASFNADYLTKTGLRNVAETTLRAAVAVREERTKTVQAQFQNAESFFDQLVERRKAVNTKAAVAASATGATKAQMDAAADAAAALTAAEATKANYERLTSDTDNPSTVLLNSLLAGDDTDGDDDGQALIDAVGTTYDKTVENAAAIEELVGTGEEDGGQVNENTAAIAALTDEDGPVTMNTENIAENKAAVEALTDEDGPVTMNTENIAENKAAVEALTDEDGPVTMNTAGVEANADAAAANAEAAAANAEAAATNAEAAATNAEGVAANVEAAATNAEAAATNAEAAATNAEGVAANVEAAATNAAAAATNAEGVAANAAAAATNAEGVAANAAAAATNAEGVAANAAAAATNAEGVAANAAAAATNAEGVAANAAAAATNAEGVAANAAAAATNAEGVAANAAAAATNAEGVAANAAAAATNAEGVAGNAGNITMNAGNITTNAEGVAGNAGNITMNAGNITTNAEGVAGNAGNIATNVTDIATNAGGIATNAGGIATNVTDIATNAGGIATNVTDIATNAGGIATNVTDIATNAGGIATNVTDIATNAGGIATNVTDIATNAGDIVTNAGDIVTNAGNIMMNANNIVTNVTDIATNAGGIATNVTDIATNAGDITMNAGGIATNASNITAAEVRIMANEGKITTNTGSIASNKSAIDANAASIGKLGNELRNDLDVVRAGVAASMALAGMPSLDGRGFAVGLGSFDGETAFAAGFLYSTDRASFKIGVTSSGGETGASVGGAWQF